LEDDNILVNVVHPGVVDTEIFRWAPSDGRFPPVFGPMGTLFNAVGRPFMRSVPNGALTTLFAATSPALLDGDGGRRVRLHPRPPLVTPPRPRLAGPWLTAAPRACRAGLRQVHRAVRRPEAPRLAHAARARLLGAGAALPGRLGGLALAARAERGAAGARRFAEFLLWPGMKAPMPRGLHAEPWLTGQRVRPVVEKEATDDLIEADTLWEFTEALVKARWFEGWARLVPTPAAALERRLTRAFAFSVPRLAPRGAPRAGSGARRRLTQHAPGHRGLHRLPRGRHVCQQGE
jgi:hypothetical protein